MTFVQPVRPRADHFNRTNGPFHSGTALRTHARQIPNVSKRHHSTLHPVRRLWRPWEGMLRHNGPRSRYPPPVTPSPPSTRIEPQSHSLHRITPSARLVVSDMFPGAALLTTSQTGSMWTSCVPNNPPSWLSCTHHRLLLSVLHRHCAKTIEVMAKMLLRPRWTATSFRT